MTTPIFNITGQEGATVSVRVQVQEPDGTAADLTGYTGTMQVRPDLFSDEVLATGTVTFEADVVVATLPAAQTVDWSAGVYDVRIESGGVVEYVCRGEVVLTPSVTQA